MSETTPAPEEQILVIPKSEFEKRSPFAGFAPIGEERTDLGEYLQGAPIKLASFMPRSQAETDESFLQIIPYLTLLCNDSVLTYRRAPSGGEDRLHGKLSVGVGGHINDEDDPDEPFYAFLAGAKRELFEETGLDLPHDVFKGSAAGLLYDDSDAVGRVHLGVSIILNLTEELAKKALNGCEQHMHAPQWTPIASFSDPAMCQELEGWSGFVINYLLAETSQEGKWTDLGFKERVNMLAICAANLASASAGFLMQSTPRGHAVSRAMVEEAAGQTQAMLAGVVFNDDISQHKLKKAGQAFQADLPNILKHQS